MRIAAVYKNPGTALQLVDIDNLLDPILLKIISGDLNAKRSFWYSHMPSTVDQVLFSHINITNFVVTTPKSPTHNPDQHNTGPMY